MAVRVEPGGIGARAKLQHAAALRMPLAASLWGTSPPRVAPTSAALVVVRNVLRLMSGVCVCLSMVVSFAHEGCMPSPLSFLEWRRQYHRHRRAVYGRYRRKSVIS